MYGRQPPHARPMVVHMILVGWLLDALAFLFLPIVGFDFGAMIAESLGGLGGLVPSFKVSFRLFDILGFARFLQSLLNLARKIGEDLTDMPFNVQGMIGGSYIILQGLVLLTFVGYAIFLFALGKWMARPHKEPWPQSPGHTLNLVAFGVGSLHLLYFLMLVIQKASFGAGMYLPIGAWTLFLGVALLLGGTGLYMLQSPQFTPYRNRLREAMQRRPSWFHEMPTQDSVYDAWAPPPSPSPSPRRRGYSPSPAPPPPPPRQSAPPLEDEGFATRTVEFGPPESASDTQMFVEGGEDAVQAWLEAPDGKRYPLRLPQTTIGRLSDNDIPISHPSISKRHARIFYQNGRFWLEDLGSTNGTKVGGRRIRGQTVPLESGVEIQFGVIPPMRFLMQ